MIRLENVCRTYQVGGAPLHALVDVTEHFEAGEHVAIMGPSGSGKSTLLHVIGCLDRPTSGRILLQGRDVSGLEENELSVLRRELIGFVFQSYHLVPRLDAAGNVELPMVFAGIPRRERRERVAEALESVGLGQRARHRPAQLSGGERQRIALARAVIFHPSIILADEPTGNLDSRSGEQVLDLLDGLNDTGITLLVVTHDTRVAQRAGRMLILEDGRIAQRVSGTSRQEAER